MTVAVAPTAPAEITEEEVEDYLLVPQEEFFEDWDEDGLWYGLEIVPDAWFRFEYEFDYKCTLNDFGVWYGLEWSETDHDWGYYGSDENYAVVWPEITRSSSITDLPNVSTSQSIYAFIDNGSKWIPVGQNAASLGLANVSTTEVAYALIDNGSSWEPLDS